MEKQRCFNCNKKLKLINYSCKCEHIFCIKCRLPENHKCTFNFKLNEKERLNKTLIKVVAEKVIKI